MPLRNMVLLVLLAVGLVPLAVTTAAYLPGIQDALQESARERAEALSLAARQDLQHRLEEGRKSVQLLSILPLYPELIGAGKLSGIHVLPESTAVARYNVVVERWFQDARDIIGLSVLDTQGMEKLRFEHSPEGVFNPRGKLRSRAGQPCYERAISGKPDIVYASLVRGSEDSICLEDEAQSFVHLSKQLVSPDGTPIGVLVLSMKTGSLLVDHPESTWIHGDGAYLKRPFEQTAPHAGAGDAYQDFPGLKPLLKHAATQVVYRSANGESLVWSRLQLDPRYDETLWIGQPVDQSPLEKLLARIRSIAIGVTIITVLIVLASARWLAQRVDSTRTRIVEAVHSITRGQRLVDIHWGGPSEVRALAQELGLLADLHADSEEARRRAEANLHAEQARVRQLNQSLEIKVDARTRDLEQLNQELQAFSYTVSHDLRAPLRSINGFSEILIEDHAERFDAETIDYLQRIRRSGKSMAELIEDLLSLSMVMRGTMRSEHVDLSAAAERILARLRESDPGRSVTTQVQPGLFAQGDSHLLDIALDNLLTNAWKYTAQNANAHIEFGCNEQHGRQVFFVRDNGAGFDMRDHDRLFEPFQRLHEGAEYEGTGIGLATVQRIIRRHNGALHAEGRIGEGATFYFTLGETAS